LIIAKIDYINLLPFYVFIKKSAISQRVKSSINYKKSYPSKINRDFRQRRVDGGFISSIESSGKKSIALGIVAKKDIMSVIVLDGKDGKDSESATSNVLAKVLGIKGQVMIGDKALKYYLDNDIKPVDLASVWFDRYNLPFVFALFCFNTHKKFFKKLEKSFVRTNIKIPQYILNSYSKKNSINKKDIIKYLKKIDYKIGNKERQSLKIFLKLAKNQK
jgi:chorismate dehydratase